MSPAVVTVSPNPTPATADLKSRFIALKLQWESSIDRTSSSAMASFSDPAYYRIIALGPDVIPYILEDLADPHSLNHWFHALAVLSGHDAAQEITKFRDAIDAWLVWGREQGLYPVPDSVPTHVTASPNDTKEYRATLVHDDDCPKCTTSPGSAVPAILYVCQECNIALGYLSHTANGHIYCDAHIDAYARPVLQVRSISAWTNV